MVIGLRYGRIRADDIFAKEKTYAVVREFLQEFKTCHGSVACTELIRHNLSNSQQLAEAKKKSAVKARCPTLVRDAVTLLEKVAEF